MRQDEEFAPLRIVKKNLTDFDRCAYRVYKSTTEYVTVDAATALEAFRESGIASPLRIMRETRFMERLVDQSKFTEIEELIETGVIMEAPMAFTGHREAVPQAAPRPQPEMPVVDAPVMEEPQAVMEAAAPTSPPAAQAMVEAVEAEELSEEDVHALLGVDEQERAQAATAGEDGLSPDDVAALLAPEKKNS